MNSVSFSTLGWQAWISMGASIGVLGVLIFTQLPAHLVFMAGLTVLLVSGVLDMNSALDGFSAPGMITVGLLYMVVSGLQETGALTWVSQKVLGRPRGIRKAQVRLLPPVIGLSAFLNNTPVVAMFIPVVTGWCRRLGISPSKLLLPLSYASIFGGICIMIGASASFATPIGYQTNMMVYGPGGYRFGDYLKFGIPLNVTFGMVAVILAPLIWPL